MPGVYVLFASIDSSGRLLGYRKIGCLIDSGADRTFLPLDLLPVLKLSADALPKVTARDAQGKIIGELPQAQLVAHVFGRGIEITACFGENFPIPLLGREDVFDSLNIAFVRNEFVFLARAS